jgi:uncharacterized membrane protein YdfJ with MMPL/SSD domain
MSGNSGMLGGLGAACYRHRWLTVVVRIAGVACLIVLWMRFGAAADTTARVISAAAAIMVVVFLSFDLTPDVSVKQIGLGLAAAVLAAATVVRLVLVPAVMELLGKANWWLPGWLDRLLPARRAEALSAHEPAAVTSAAAR